jgi:hypothetical protein
VGETGNQPGPDRVAGSGHHDGDGRRRLLRRLGRRGVHGQDDIDPEPHELVGEPGEAFGPSGRVPHRGAEVLALDVTQRAELVPERLDEAGGRAIVQEHAEVARRARRLGVDGFRRPDERENENENPADHWGPLSAPADYSVARAGGQGRAARGYS